MKNQQTSLFRYFGLKISPLMVGILPMTMAAQNIGPLEIYGAVVDEFGSPMAGVKVMLKSRSDSAVTGADGLYRLRFPTRTISVFPGAAKPPRIRAGKLYVGADPGMGVGMEAFNALGRRVSPSRVSQGEKAIPTAKMSGPELTLDTLVVEKTGYYSHTVFLYEYPLANLPMMPFRMFPNSIHGLDPGEITAWKDFLSKPTVTLRLTRSRIELPRENTGGAIVKADGEVVSEWSSDECKPGDLPKAVRLDYVKDGREFRDTIPLASFWNLLHSFRATADSAAPGRKRYAMTWDWPEGISARPERDWMAVKLGDMSVDEFISYPDVNQVGVQLDFEGGVTKYGQFLPGSESLTVVVTSVRPGPKMKARFTWKSHAGHDLRIDLDDYSMPEPSKDFAFVTSWPSAGLRARDSLRLAQQSNPPLREASLVFSIPGNANEWTIDPRWDGRDLDWKFPFPTRGDFQLRIRATERLYRCPAVAESPLLRILPDPSDTAVTAFEPNEDEDHAALVPKGVLLRAAWDFRPEPNAQPDEDFYRFQAAAGEKIRISVVNPNAWEITVMSLCDDQQQVVAIEPMADGAHTFTVDQAGDCRFFLNMDEPTGGRYQFRVDTVD